MEHNLSELLLRVKSIFPTTKVQFLPIAVRLTGVVTEAHSGGSSLLELGANASSLPSVQLQIIVSQEHLIQPTIE